MSNHLSHGIFTSRTRFSQSYCWSTVFTWWWGGSFHWPTVPAMIAGRRTMQTDGKQIILVTRKDIWLHEKWGQLYRHCLNWKHGMARVLCLAPKPSGKQTVLIFMAQKLGRETQRVPLNSTKTGPGWTRLCLQDWFLPLNGPFCHLLSFANMPALLVWADLMPAHASLHLLRRVTRAFNFDLA